MTLKRVYGPQTKLRNLLYMVSGNFMVLWSSRKGCFVTSADLASVLPLMELEQSKSPSLGQVARDLAHLGLAMPTLSVGPPTNRCVQGRAF